MGITLNPSTLLNGQGLDVSTLVTEVLANQSGELTVLENEQSTLSTNAGLLQGINNDLNSLATAVQGLADPTGALAAMAANSSDSNILTASAETSATAGTHSIVVDTLASAGMIYSEPMTNANTSFLASGSSSGDIQLQVGGSNGTTYDLPITAGSNDTLSTLASYINQQSTQNNWGLSASVVSDANGSRLAIYSQSTGTSTALAISSNNTNLSFAAPVGGTDATFTLDGVPFETQTNAVTGAIPGVTLNLASADPNTTVQLTVGADVNQATQAINNFVSAYNTVIGDINQQYTVSSSTNNEGPLAADSALRSLQTSLLNDVTYSVAGSGGTVNLASLGISMNDDGTLTVGNNASGQSLSQVLQNDPSSVLNFFQNASSTGFANNFNNDLTNLTDPTAGVLNADIAQNQTQQQNLTSDIDEFQQQLQSQQTALTQQFNQVNSTLQEYPATLNEVTSLLAGLTGSSTTSSTSSSSSTTL
ncbi:MAG TPA: flagellar filament capping protein FliD [Terriglobales bacterium]